MYAALERADRAAGLFSCVLIGSFLQYDHKQRLAVVRGQPAQRRTKFTERTFYEIIKAWHGQLAYEPSQVRSPVAIIRGEWDGLIPDEDARWLFAAFTGAPVKRDIKISRGTHLMHLEAMRLALWRESIGFLCGDDVASVSTEITEKGADDVFRDL
jgi:pimeloyl-ACP methyl ester carboxylesterase